MRISDNDIIQKWGHQNEDSKDMQRVWKGVCDFPNHNNILLLSVWSSCCTPNEKKRLKEKREERKRLKSASEPILTIQEPSKEFLTPSDVAKLLGVSLPTVYRYFAPNIIKAVKIRRNTFVRRKDLNTMFESATYKKRAYHRKVTDEVAYYTMREIMDKYKIGKKAKLSRCDRFGIPKIYEGRNFYYNRKSVDEHFSELLEEIDLSNYYTVNQLMEKLNMKRGNVLNFVARNKVPRITRGRDVFYSKIYIDSSRGRVTNLTRIGILILRFLKSMD